MPKKPAKPTTLPVVKRGPPATEFTPEQVDDCKGWLGRCVRPSVVVAQIAQKYGFSRDVAYNLIAATREDVVRSIQQAGTAADPLTAVYLFYEEAMADQAREFQHRLTAAAGIVKLLGLDRILKNMDTLGVEEFLAGVLARRLARGKGDDGDAGEGQ